VVRTFEREPLEQNKVVPSAADDETARTLVGSGGKIKDQEIVIVDPSTGTRCAPASIGEIWVSGPSIGKGYWNRPEETAHTFHAYIADSGEGPFLRSLFVAAITIHTTLS
jgi:acyl-CoA synthetase (AMP-forming)/AMP-acid ligase II